MRDIEISASDARDLTDRIKTGVEAIWELIKQAYQSRAWAALGYDSWDDYCTREFGTSRIRLPREERSEVVASLRESGLSIRAISSATGIARNTVRNELRADSEVGQIDPPTEPQPITGTDGKTYTPRPTPRPEPEPEQESVGEEDTPAPSWEPAGHIHPADLAALNRPEPPATPHTKQEPQAPRRKPITDDVLNAVVDLQKALRKWESIVNDDRFPANKKQVGDLHLSDLHRAETSLKTIIAKFH